MKHYYLIDYENIKTSGLASVKSRFNKKDEIYIFYSDKANTMNMETMEDLLDRDLNIKYIKVKNGQKDALDWQLATFLGYLVRKLRKKDYQIHIISRDKGFQILLSFWEDENIDIITIKEEAKTIEVKEPTVLKKTKRTKKVTKEKKEIIREPVVVKTPTKNKKEDQNYYLLAISEGDYQGVYKYHTHKQRKKIEKMVTCDKSHKKCFPNKEEANALSFAGVSTVSSIESITTN